jgi:glycosyltransferase involved in cell wall biosynthesis
MDLSVIICTRNRAPSLGRALESIAAAEKPAGLRWELLVVDNGSTDATAEAVAAISGRLPVRYVKEPMPGLSLARNRAVAEAKGRYLIWTDDDVGVDAGWLCAYWAGFQRHPEGAVFGGKILPVLEPPVTRWFLLHFEDLKPLMAHRDLGDTPMPLTVRGGHLPFGANYAVRATEQRTHAYDPELGVSPGRHRSGEESAVIKAILRAGHPGYWVPDAVVNHYIAPERQTENYVLSYYRGLGESWVLETGGREVRARAFHQARRLLSYMLYRLAPRLPGMPWIRFLRSYAFHTGVVAMIESQAAVLPTRSRGAAHLAPAGEPPSEG